MLLKHTIKDKKKWKEKKEKRKKKNGKGNIITGNMIWYYWTFDLWSLIWNPSSSQKQSGVVLEIEIEGFIKNITWIDNIPLLKKWFQLFVFKYLLNICRHIFRYPLHPNLYKYLYFKNGLSKSVRKVGNSPCIMEKNVDLFFQKVLYSKFIKSGRCILAKSCV